MEKAANPFLYVGERSHDEEMHLLLWLLMAVCFCSPAGAETGLYFFIMGWMRDAVCYALEVTTEDGEVLYADDSVWQNEVISGGYLTGGGKFSGVCGLSIYTAGLSMAGPKESLLMRRRFSGTGSASSPSG